MSAIIQSALAQPNGARFYRCAFQVNPFEYLVRHDKKPAQLDEAAYNREMVDALLAAGIEVIAVTDHYRVRSAATLMEAARTAGIVVFPGFEASTREGIHVLCLFDPCTPLDMVQAKIHSCGVHDESVASPLGNLSSDDLLAKCGEWGMQCIAAHVTMRNGLLTTLQGQAKALMWRNPNLLAVAIPGSVGVTPIEHRHILENKNPDYKRNRPLAILNCSDLCKPEDAAGPGMATWVKMTSPTLEGLRQAFLDPDSRIRLTSDPDPEEHVEFVAMTWETAGFLRNLKIHLNENLNVLIGGRGTGKSTVIESLRYVLDLPAIGPEAAKVHSSIVQNVLKSGTKISLAVQSYRPDRRLFVIERTINNPPVVRDGDTGDVLPLKPLDIVPRATAFGQNEISELARSPEKLTALLDRYTAAPPNADENYKRSKNLLAESRREIIAAEKRLAEIEEQLASLPGLEETLKRYRDAGIEDKLKDQATIIREEGIVDLGRNALQPFEVTLRDMEGLLPISQEAFDDKNLDGLPSKEKLADLRTALTTFEGEVRRAGKIINDALRAAGKAIDKVETHVEGRKSGAQAEYEKVLRELQKDKIDGAEFVRLRAAIEKLRPLSEQKTRTGERIAALLQQRRNELANWEDIKRQQFERLQKAAAKIGKQLAGCVRVTVTYAGDRQGLMDLLKSKPGGRLAETVNALQVKPDLSVAALAQACRNGASALTKEFGVPASQAQRLAEAGSELPMLIEELDLPPTTDVELNVGPEGGDQEWRALKDLSTGQKATAMLYLLLIDSEAPLVVDQLEDNLDNRFISEGIVPKIKSEKRRRQFIFATHNANVPVLGDAELILGFSAVGEAGDGHLELAPERCGSIDTPAVAGLIEVLEGGKDAFTTRRLKYGF